VTELVDGRDCARDALERAGVRLRLPNVMAHVAELDGSSRDAVDALEDAVRDEPVFRRKRWADAFELGLYRLLPYAIVREREPAVVVETGVLHGLSSLFLLRALERNGGGRLISIDLPSYDAPASHDGFVDTLPRGRGPGWIVPQRLRSSWQLHLGRSLDLLPGVLRDAGTIDIFIHDSDHTYATMSTEYELAWEHLARGGLLVSDNIDCNTAFDDFCRSVAREPLRFPDTVRERVDPTAWRFAMIEK
jgi:hypothetical protein